VLKPEMQMGRLFRRVWKTNFFLKFEYTIFAMHLVLNPPQAGQIKREAGVNPVLSP
jgi:hypothetical protein